jgi:hypothetical protein
MTLFISHCTADDPFVDRLAVELQAQGFDTWIDHVDMPPGTRWVSHLEKALEESDAMLLILSDNSVASTYVQSEWHVFFDMKRPIFPIRLSDCPTPLFLRTFHHLDFRNQSSFLDQVNLLMTVLPDPDGETLAMRPLEDNTQLCEVSDDNDKWQEYHNLIRKTSHRLIQRYARPLQNNEVQIIMPMAQDILQYALEDRLIIGRRHEASGHFPDIDLHEFHTSSKVSRKHAELRRGRRGLNIVDLKSTNGTYINKDKLKAGIAYPLPNNAIVFLGSGFPIVVHYRL